MAESLVNMLNRDERILHVPVTDFEVMAVIEAINRGLISGDMDREAQMKARWFRDRLGNAWAARNARLEGGRDD